MKFLFNFLTLLFFNNVFPQANINSTFYKATLNTVSKPQNQGIGDYQNNNFLQQKNTIVSLIYSRVTQTISFFTGTFLINAKV